jgi:hypothetical protein
VIYFAKASSGQNKTDRTEIERMLSMGLQVQAHQEQNDRVGRVAKHTRFRLVVFLRSKTAVKLPSQAKD